VRVPGNLRPEQVIQRLGPELPEGLRIIDCRMETSRPKGRRERLDAYEVTLTEGCFEESLLEKFKRDTEVIVRRQNRKGRVSEIDLKRAVRHLALEGPEKMKLVLSLEGGKTLRPGIVLEEIFQLSGETVRNARILKTETVYT